MPHGIIYVWTHANNEFIHIEYIHAKLNFSYMHTHLKLLVSHLRLLLCLQHMLHSLIPLTKSFLDCISIEVQQHGQNQLSGQWKKKKDDVRKKTYWKVRW